MVRLPFRFTPRSAIEFGAASLLGLVGLILLLGTTDEYKARRAFNRAMDSYAAGVMMDVHDDLEDALTAKPEYTAPREALAKLLVDDGKFGEATRLYEDLQRREQSSGGRPSLPVFIGLAVAELEAARAAEPKPEALAAAFRKARSSLEATLTTHAASGDVHVNLATIALLENDLARCKAELAKVNAAGNISPDALPVLYNLSGLLALREKQFVAATGEFEKVKEFKPEWDVPQLNLAAAQAQFLVAPGVQPHVAERSAAALRRLLPVLRRSQSPIYGLICQAYATYAVGLRNLPAEAIAYFSEGEKYSTLGWQSRFNLAIAQYLNVRASRRKAPPALHAALTKAFAQALALPEASPRDKFLACCLLGALEAKAGSREEAIAHFERAVALAAETTDPFVLSALSRVHVNLLALYLEADDLPKVGEHLKKAEELAGPDEKKKLDRVSRQLRAAPIISGFVVKHEKLFTEYDLRATAALSTPGSPRVLSPECVALSLVETVSGAARRLPFELNGPVLHAVAVNLPQGKYRVELVLTDALGNSDKAVSEIFAFDRDAPRVVKCQPDAGATVASLSLLEFRVEDSFSEVDLSNLRVMLRYPPGSPVATRTLVSGGKVQFPSSDGSIARGADVTPDVRVPMPPDRLLKGQYQVLVHVQDVQGKGRDIEWSFTLAP